MRPTALFPCLLLCLPRAVPLCPCLPLQTHCALSGEAFAERVGQAWNDADTAAKAEIGDKVDFYQASPEIVAALKAKAGELEQKWSDSLGQGYDGAAALAEFRKETGVNLE